MKSISIAALVAFGFAGAASAADIYGNGSLKDGPDAAIIATHSGLYISGNLGIASGDRTIRGSVEGSKNELLRQEPNEDYDAAKDVDGDGVDSDGDEQFDLETASSSDLDDAAAVLVNGDNIFRDLLRFGGEDSFNSTVFGGELSYLWQIPGRRVALELGLGGTFYTGGETEVGFAGTPTLTSVHEDWDGGSPYPDAGEPNIYSQDGSLKFDRDFDIDLVAKGHIFVANNLSIYAGGGVSWARANLKGGHASSYFVDGVLDNGFDESDTSLGYVLTAGVQWWATDRIVVGLDYTYKAHEFDFDSGRSSNAAVGGTAYNYGTSDKVSVDDEVHAVKAKVGFKLN